MRDGSVKLTRGLNAQGFDAIKRGLDGAVEFDQFGNVIPDSQSPGNRNVNLARKAWVTEGRSAIPGYSDALDASGDYLSQKGAYDGMTGSLFNRSVDPRDVATQFTSASPSEQAAMQASMANDIYTRSQNGLLRPGDFGLPHVGDKLTAVFGPQAAGKLSDSIAQETAMLPAERTVPPNNGSPTMGLLAAQADQDGGINFGQVAGDAVGSLLAHGGNPAAAAPSFLARQISRVGSNLKTPGMPVATRDEAGRLLLMSPSDFSDYLQQVLPTNASAPPQGIIGAGAPASNASFFGVGPGMSATPPMMGLFGASGDDLKRQAGIY